MWWKSIRFPYESARKWGKQYVSTISSFHGPCEYDDYPITQWIWDIYGYLSISDPSFSLAFFGAVMGYPLILDEAHLLGTLLSGCAPRPGPCWKSAPGHL